MATIAIDCRFASTTSGLGRYTRELVTHILALPTAHRFILLIPADAGMWAASLPPSDHWATRVVCAPHYSFVEHWEIPHALRAYNADLFFSPHFNVPWHCPVPFVMTVHDLILHRYPNAAPFWKRAVYRLILTSALHRASHIITVSQFVRGEVQSVYGSSIEQEVSVILEGVSSHFSRRSEMEQQNLQKKYGITRPFFLYVGNAKEHKNVSFLLQAWQKAQLAESELLLVMGGKEAEAMKLPQGARHIAHLDDRDLPALYSAARAFVTASLYEGFCLPVAEALACECPVIALREGPLEEVTQGQALLLEPSLEAFVHAFHSPPPPPPSFKRPSWEEAARETVALFERTLRYNRSGGGLHYGIE